MSRNIKALFRRATSFLNLLLHATWAVPILLLIRIIKPVIYIRFGRIWSARIGHFVVDSTIYLNMKGDNRFKIGGEIHLFCLTSEVCNQQWKKMVCRQLLICKWVEYLIRINQIIPGGRGHYMPLPTAVGAGFEYKLQDHSKSFTFSGDEVIKAKKWLTDKGWDGQEKFVCFLVRDDAYLSGKGYGENYSHHDYRNSTISAFNDAMNALIDKNYWVIRMGSVANKPVNFKNSRLIDYPYENNKDDLMDIWLSANCAFFVSTSSGLDWVAALSGRPIVIVNGLPLFHGALLGNRIWVPKNLRWKKNGNNLSLNEYYSNSYLHTRDYDEANIEIEELSPQELKDAVLECESRTVGQWIESGKSKALQKKTWEIAKAHPFFQKYYTKDIRCENIFIGTSWLEAQESTFYE